jgi:redox-sensitive bicupin YhaK (pirin superfamily)
MITLRKAHERGHSTYGGWLQSAHTFSFGDYFDVKHQGYGNLRVINDDTVAPGNGFGTHGHRDMEIISYVLDGELAHKDSMGNGHDGSAASGIIRPGDVQRMSAGTGVMHSEFNHSSTQPVHFLQIWILPKFKGVRPGYEQKHFPVQQRRGQLALIVSPDGAEGSLSMNADARVQAGLFDGNESTSKSLTPGRPAYVHVARGSLNVNGHVLGSGDGALLENEAELVLSNGHQAEVLVFDLAA